MTATDAIWTQGGSFTATEDRSLISALTGARHFTDLAPGISKVDAGGGHGIVGANDLAVTPGSGHSVDVASGQAFIRGTQSAGQGTYLVGNDATVNLAISTPDATNDRIDLIQIRVSDDSAGAGVTTIDVKAGTPAGSPSAPTPDENTLVLAQVLVPASAASSANYTITDRRTRAAALGGVHVCTSSTRPDPVTEGQVIYETDTNVIRVYDGSNWQPVATLGGWTSFTPTWTGVTLGTSPVSTGRYLVDGKRLTFEAALKLGSGTGNVTATIEMAGPAGILARSLDAGLTGVPVAGSAWAIDASAGSARYSAGFMAEKGTNKWVWRIGTGGGNAWDGTTPFNWDPSDELYVAGVLEIS